MIHFNSKIVLNSHTALKNRVIVPAMASSTADEKGYVTPKTTHHYHTLAKSRASLVIVEYTYVCPGGRSEMNQLGIYNDFQIEGLKKVANSIKEQGAKAAIQLTHAGGKTHRELTGGRLISPSGVTVYHQDNIFSRPDIASKQDIKSIQTSFVNAAKRAHSAGFDGIEIHCAHGYGLNQWISPLTNKRSDPYGGCRENRLRILIEIIRMIKTCNPSLFVSVRIPGEDYVEDGLSLEESQKIAQLLELEGVEILSISSGLAGWKRPKNKRGEGYLVDAAQSIKSSVTIPVVGVGGICTSGFINASLQNQAFDLAAIGRAILNNPCWGSQVGLT